MTGRLRKKAQSLPQKAGIYFFKNQTGEVIYIGKARSLRSRVKSYFQQTSDAKIKNILSETWDIDFILTDSTKEAAFLENNFIRQHQPRYNLRLKDDKSFPYLKMTIREGFPALTLTRRVEEDGAKYYGPYSPAHRARQTSHLIAKYFGVRTCQEAVPGRRKRPCLDYDLKLCSAPCVSNISKKDYRESVDNALLFLEGKTEKLLSALKTKMREASARQEFEQAARWRDLIRTIEEIKKRPKLISVRKEDIDIFGLTRENENVAVYIFVMRAGKVIESEELYFQEKKEVQSPEILSSCVREFYRGGQDIPDKILLPFPPEKKEELSQILFKRKRKKVEILTPLKGKYKKLVDMTNTNAEILMQKKSEALSPLKETQKILELKTLPVRIEGYDISNTGGDESVGSLVVFENGLPQKNDYRKYKIKSVEGPNDVASLQEVIKRRCTRLLQEEAAFPDLILVDGGKGQLNAARVVIKELGLGHLPVIALAKKEEIIFTPSHKNGIRLEKTSPALKLIQSIRDESHRFALSFHRIRRRKKSFASRLNGIKGIGPKKKAALLAKYKSLREIENASRDELSMIIGRKAAQSLVDKLKTE